MNNNNEHIYKVLNQSIARDQAKALERQASYSKQAAEAQIESLENFKKQSKAMIDLISSLQSLTQEQKNQNEILQKEIDIKNKHEHKEKIVFWFAIGINLALAISSIGVLIFR